MIAIRVEVKGVREAIAKLEAFKDGAVNGLLRSGVAKASSRTARVLKQDVARMSASRTGLMQKALGFRVRKYAKGIWAGVSARYGMARTVPGLGRVNPAKYLHLYERGRKAIEAKPGRVIPIKTLRGPTVTKRTVLGRGVRSTKRGKVRRTLTRGGVYYVAKVRAAPGRHLLARRADLFERFLESQIVQTVRAGWERLVSNPRAYRTGPADETGD